MSAATDERLPDPPFFSGFPRGFAIRRMAGGDPRATAAQLEAFRKFATVGDPLADAVVEETRSLPPGEGRRLFEQALAEGRSRRLTDAPPALAAFFDQVESVPSWLDRDKLDVAARAMTRTGLLGLYFFPDIALIGGYLASKPDKVLVRAGDLDRKAAGRLAETANWWVEITTPGNLDRFADGFKGAVRVRLTHAHIRAAMHRREDWNYEEWDHPVNQIHTVGTLILFSVVFTAALRALGFRFSADEQEAIIHFWRYVGHLMGVHPELLPATRADAWRVTWLEAATEFIPDEDSRRLARAMMDASNDVHGLSGGDPVTRVAGWLIASVHSSYGRLVLGAENADHLGLPNRPPFHAAVAAITGANFALETARSLIPGAGRLSVFVGDRSRRAMLRRVTRLTGADLTYTREPKDPVVRRAA